MTPAQIKEEQLRDWDAHFSLHLTTTTNNYQADEARLRMYSNLLRNAVQLFFVRANKIVPQVLIKEIERLIEEQVSDERRVGEKRFNEALIAARALFAKVTSYASVTSVTAADQPAGVTSSNNTAAGNSAVSSFAISDTSSASNSSARNSLTRNSTLGVSSAAREGVINTSTANTTKDMGDETKCANVPVDKCVIEYPRRSSTYYVLNCPICKSHFETVRALYSHINISHQGIMTGDKAYTDALEIGGTLVTDADTNWVVCHNDDYNMNKNVSCTICLNTNNPFYTLFAHSIGDTIQYARD